MSEADRIQDALRAMAARGRDLVHVDPFVLTIDPSTTLEFLNYAVPRKGARIWPGEAIDALCSAFEQRGRMPRLEFVEDCWPGLRPALEPHGFSVDLQPLGMVCRDRDLIPRPAPPGFALEAVRRDAPARVIAELFEVRRRAFGDGGQTGSTGDAEIQRFREHGSDSVLARAADGRAVGAASWQPAQLDVTEIVAVGVVEPDRGRGIAGALTAAAARDAFDHGVGLAFLTPGGDEAARVYERAGFRPALRCLHMSRR